jgi:hypothetical protein
MKNFLSTLLIALALALFVPNNGAEALRMAAAPSADSVPVSLEVGDEGLGATESPMAPTPTMTWILALGFLGVVVARRMR